MIDDEKPLPFTVANSTGLTWKSQKYKCPTHGITEDGCVSFWNDGKLEANYCMTCYKEMVRKFCFPATPV